MTTLKKSTTTKEFKASFKGYDFVVPVGSIVDNWTSTGSDDVYYFWSDYQKIAEEITGHAHSMLSRDLEVYGLNIPADYCKPYAHLGENYSPKEVAVELKNVKKAYSLNSLIKFTIKYLKEIIASDEFDDKTKGLAARVLRVKYNP